MVATPDSVWTAEVMMKVRQVGGVRVSPDGHRVVFAVREAVMAPEKSDYLTQIFLAHAAGGDQIQLTYGQTSSVDPHWSPDGRWIAFTSKRSGKNNVWLIRVNGGEAQQLTDVLTDASSFKWSPDGRWIAYTAADPPTPQEEQAVKGKNDAQVVGENTRMEHLYLISVQAALDGKRQPQQLTKDGYTVGVADIPAMYDWSPDGKTIAFAHTRTPGWDDWMSAGISLVEVDSGAVRPLLCEEPAAIDPHFSPDARWVACKVYDQPAWEWSSVVHLVSLDDGRVRTLAATDDRRPDIIGWSVDGTQLYYAESWGTRQRIHALPVDGGPPKVLYEPEGIVAQVALNRSRTAFGFVLESSSVPPEAHVSRLNTWSPVQVSQANEAFHNLPLGHTEVIRWSSKDGLEIEGLLTCPVDYRPGLRYPLILSIHGGPASVFSQDYIGRPSIYGALAALAARGYAVLRCNVRGSTGYGKAFRRANYRDWGGMDFQDLMTGIDHVIAMGVADPERLGVLGWSYGGFLTASVITQTRRFRAAVVGAGITNLISNAGSCDTPSFTVSHFGGELWEVAELLCPRSPTLNAANVTTPTLILHGEHDVRVPVSQGREFYNALKRRGCSVRMVVYPRTGHVPHEPKLLQDVMVRTIEWMNQYVLE